MKEKSKEKHIIKTRHISFFVYDFSSNLGLHLTGFLGLSDIMYHIRVLEYM